MNENPRVVTVLHGPSVWQGRSAEVVKEDGDFVTLEIADRDDGKDGRVTYTVIMPKACVKDGPPVVAKA